MMPFVKIEAAYIRPDAVEAILDNGRGGARIRTLGGAVIETALSPGEVIAIIEPPPIPFDPEDIPF